MSVLRVLVPALLALSGLATGCRGDVAGGRPDGPAVYAEVCARCHGDGGKPSEAMASQLNVRDLTDPAFGGRATLDSIVGQVRRGSSNKIMPAFEGSLTDDQIHAVSAYVLSLSRE